MRLRFLHLHSQPPLRDLPVTFRREATLATQPLTLHLLVGLNGTGKTRLLQLLAETFVALDRDHLPPPFPITLAYDRRLANTSCTILFHHPGGAASKARLAIFQRVIEETDLDTLRGWSGLAEVLENSSIKSLDDLEKLRQSIGKQAPLTSAFQGDSLPGTGAIEAYLPSPLLVYTSGYSTEWEELFTPTLPEAADLENFYLEEPRPRQWSAQAEHDHQLRKVLIDNLTPPQFKSTQAELDYLRGISSQLEVVSALRIPTAAEQRERANVPQVCYFIGSAQLKLVACAVLIHQSTRPNADLQKLLHDEVDWDYPVTLTLAIDFRPERWGAAAAQRCVQLADLYRLASVALTQPTPSLERQLVLDLRCPLAVGLGLQNHFAAQSATVGEAALNVLGGENPTIFEIFRTLSDWHTLGILTDANFTFRKHTRTETDLLAFDWLSDGERLFLSRIALFYLLQGEDDALLILDEPETHFNDAWKRNLVDILEQALKETHSEVMLTSHASITITDAYADEIIWLRRVGAEIVQEGTIPILLAAEQGEPLRDMLGGERSTGRRAQRQVEDLLKTGTVVELEALLDKVGPGHFRFKIIRELEARVPSHPTA